MAKVGKNPTRRVSEIEKVEKYKERLAKANVHVPKHINSMEGLKGYLTTMQKLLHLKHIRLKYELANTNERLEAVNSVLVDIIQEVIA